MNGGKFPVTLRNRLDEPAAEQPPDTPALRSIELLPSVYRLQQRLGHDCLGQIRRHQDARIERVLSRGTAADPTLHKGSTAKRTNPVGSAGEWVRRCGPPTRWYSHSAREELCDAAARHAWRFQARHSDSARWDQCLAAGTRSPRSNSAE